MAKFEKKQSKYKNTITCFYLEKLIEYQSNQVFNWKQSNKQNLTIESNDSHRMLKISTNIQLNKSLNFYLLTKHLTYSLNSISFEHLFKLLIASFSKNFVLNKTNQRKHESNKKESEILNLNEIKNIDDSITDQENYDEEDTVATTVTTYTNVTNSQPNIVDNDDNSLLIGSWFYKQTNSVEEETSKEKENVMNMSNSTQILDTTFDLDTENNTDSIVIIKNKLIYLFKKFFF